MTALRDRRMCQMHTQVSKLNQSHHIGPAKLCGLSTDEAVHLISGHALLRNQHLLGTVDDEVTALIVHTGNENNTSECKDAISVMMLSAPAALIPSRSLFHSPLAHVRESLVVQSLE